MIRLISIICVVFSVLFIGCDTEVPSAATDLEIIPGPVGKTANPALRGVADEGMRVQIFGNTECEGVPLNVDGADKFMSAAGISVAVAPRSETPFSVQVLNPNNDKKSECTAAEFTYLHDPDAPMVPMLTGTTPASPAHDTNPKVLGSTEPGALVEIFLEPTCTEEPAGIGAADEATGHFEVAIVVPANTVSRIYARATDAAQNASRCSFEEESIVYIEDSSTSVTLISIEPESPSQDQNPVVTGTAEANATITLWDNDACSGAPVGTGTADSNGDFSASVLVQANTESTIRAVARDVFGNESSCPSDGIHYIHDTTAPDAPVLTESAPVGPANNNNPTISGAAEPGSRIDLYAIASSEVGDCEGDILASTTATEFGVFSFTVNVADDSSTRFSARATDLAGNLSACSTQNVTYVEDSTVQPVTFTSTAPTSPSKSANVRIKGVAEAGSTVELFVAEFTNTNCSPEITTVYSGTAEEFAGDGILINVPNPDMTVYIRGRVTDSVGNVSACSTTYTTYVRDNTPPDVPTFDAPEYVRTKSSNFRLDGHSWGASQAFLFSGANCPNFPFAITDVFTAGFNFFYWFYDVALPTNGTTRTISAMAQDAAGNVSSCTPNTVKITRDNTAPSAPSMISVSPPSPSTDRTPVFRVRTVPSKTGDQHTVRIVRLSSSGSSCPTIPGNWGDVTVPISGASTVDVYVTVDTSAAQPVGTTYYYRAVTRDQAGNDSNCSGNTISYTTN